MKKTILILLALTCVCAWIAGCHSPEPSYPSGFAEGSDSVESFGTGPSSPSEATLPEYVPGSIKLQDQDMDDYPFERKYRITYYRLWGEFEDLLSEEEKKDMETWFEEFCASTDYGETAEEMLLVSFLKRYQITREEFDAALERYIAYNEVYVDFNDEEWEIPNGDILYTFDNEIINHYYRYE